jgi:CopG family transcriptional regulator/antitoxin EndoAI
MQRRINITLSEDTIRLLDRVAEKGDRSRLIDEAVRHYIHKAGRANLRKLLKEGAIRRADQDRQIAEEWFPVEEEAWQNLKK